MNILFSYPSYRFTDKQDQMGGEERVVWETISRLALRGHCCFVVGPSIELTQNYPNIIPYYIKGCDFRREKNPLLKRFKALRFAVCERLLIKRIIKNRPIDLIHHLRPAYPGFFSSVADLSPPFIYGPVTVKYDREIESGKKESRLYQRLKNLLYEKTLRHAAVILCQVNFASRFIPQRFASKTEILYNAIDTQTFKPLKDKKNRKRKIILCLAAVRKNKGSHILIRAMASVKKKYPSCVCHMVGRITEINYFQDLIDSLDLSDTVYLCGRVGREKSLEHFQSADIYCLPSLMDSSPSSLLEAMSCGLPVVSTKVMGIPEIVTHNENGILVEPNNVKVLAEALLRVLGDSVLRKRFSRNNREKMTNHFDWRNYIEKLEQIYDSVLE
jgi:glycosyltransferase involved in cell wall biosynthesis